jgi:hypothetical protein
MNKEEKKAEAAQSSCDCGCPGQCKDCRCKKAKEDLRWPKGARLPALTNMIWLLLMCVMG